MKKTALTGIRSTADQLHLGNYFGAIKPLLDFQESNDFEIIAFIANMHALTNLHDGKAIKNNILNVVKSYLASGIDPEKTLIFRQSDVPGHAQLNWILSCTTNLGYMKRMHTYKSALDEGKEEEMTMGTFNYPILMAADILLYDPDFVPVGKDQKQHLEFARDIGDKFNKTFGDTFKLPEPYIKEDVATIPGIDGRKMSKSYNNYIGLFEDEKTLLKKVKRISTDTKTVEESKNPDECNLYNIIKLFLSSQEDEQLRKRYIEGGLSYKEVKDYLYEKLLEFLKPIQSKVENISDDYVETILQNGAKRANEISISKIEDIYKKVGFK